MRGSVTLSLLGLTVLLFTVALCPPKGDGQFQSEFLPLPTAAGAQATAREMNSRMHYPGTPGDYALAVYMRDKLRQFGLQADLEPFDAIVYTPQLLQLQLLTNPGRPFDLREQPRGRSRRHAPRCGRSV